MINRLPHKLTRAQAINLGSRATRIENIGNKEQKLHILWGKLVNSNFWFTLNDSMKLLGKPNIIVRDFESSPGLWVFDDQATGIRFLVWSDCWKKHPYKGTSFEVIQGPKAFHNVEEAFERLIDVIKTAGCT